MKYILIIELILLFVFAYRDYAEKKITEKQASGEVDAGYPKPLFTGGALVGFEVVNEDGSKSYYKDYPYPNGEPFPVLEDIFDIKKQ